jgi:hypothetical protein
MATRPCRADADLKRIWQLLLPDTAFPACGVQEDAGTAASKSAAPVNETRTTHASSGPGLQARMDFSRRQVSGGRIARLAK